MDKNITYTYCSSKVRDILGYSPDQILGKTPFDFMPGREAKRVSGFFGNIIKKREAFAGLENVNRHKAGHEVVLDTNGIPFFDSPEKAAKTMAILHRYSRIKAGAPGPPLIYL